MIPSQLCASFNKCQRIVCIRGSWVFFWTLECSEMSLRFLSWLGFAWITLKPMRRQVLHNHYISVMLSRLLVFIENFGNLTSVLPDFFCMALPGPSCVCIPRNSGLRENEVNKLCFPPALFEAGVAGGCAGEGSAGGSMATSAGDTSVELEKITSSIHP